MGKKKSNKELIPSEEDVSSDHETSNGVDELSYAGSEEESSSTTKNKNAVSNEANFKLHGEDSTDEESINQALDDYVLKTQYEEYRKNQPGFLQRVDNAGFSFAAYAIGVKLLYSPEVNAYYYPKKKALGEFELVAPAEDSINSWIKDSIIASLCVCLATSDFPEIAETITNSFIKDHQAIIDSTVEKLLANKRELFKQLHVDNLLSSLEDCCGELFEALEEYIRNMQAIDNLPTIGFTIDDLATDEDVRIFILEEINAYLDRNKLRNDKGNLAGKSEREKIIPQLKSKKTTSSFHKEVLAILEEVTRARSTGSILNDHIVRLTSLKVKQALESELTSDDPIIEASDGEIEQYRFVADCDEENSLAWLGEANPKLMQRYLPPNFPKLKSLFLKQSKKIFIDTLPEQLKLLQQQYQIKLNRPVLPDSHHLKSESIYEFLANLRLAYRDQIRQIRQSIDDDDDEGEKFSRSYQFGTSKKYALETQEITTNKARRDLVINFHSYEKIFLKWCKLRDSINESLTNNKHAKIKDADLARWIISFIQHKPLNFDYDNGGAVPLSSNHVKKLHKLLPNLTYLILGCEAVRNPATLVTTPLMLERIALGKLTWKSAINKMEANAKDTFAKSQRHIKYGGGEMPMSMSPYKEEGYDADNENEDTAKKDKKKSKKLLSEPVAASRALHERYGLFAVKSYRYPGEALNEKNASDAGKISELARRENHMTTRWLEIRKPKKNTSDADKVALIDEAIGTFYTPRMD